MGFLPARLGKCLPLHSAFWEVHFSSVEQMLEALPLGISRCQSVPASHSPLHQAGGHPLFQGSPRAVLDRMPLAALESELPLGMEGSLAGAGQARARLWS